MTDRHLDQQAALWDAEAERFDEEADHGLADPEVRAAWRKLLLAHLPPAPARVADLGCGTGSLSSLLAEAGHAVDGVDLSPRMVELARAKTTDLPDVRIDVGDAYAPPLSEGDYGAVLCRHVLWAMPDPAVALERWKRLLAPGGRAVLVEGRWCTGAGLAAEETLALLDVTGWRAELTPLADPAYWGKVVSDDRYLVEAWPIRTG